MVSKTRQRHAHIEGLEELRHMTERVAPRVAFNLARTTVHGIAGKVRNAMREAAPKDEGTLRKAIVSKRRRGVAGVVVSDVRITHGKGAKHDAFYWHMIEFGTKNQPARPYIVPTVEEFGPKIPQMFREEFGVRLEKKLNAFAKVKK